VALKAKLGKLLGGLAPKSATIWLPKDRPYPRLALLDPASDGLSGVIGGLYAVWHLGVRPQWLRVGATMDLAATLNTFKHHPMLEGFQPHGGVFVAWALLPPPAWAGTVKYLAQRLSPALQHLSMPGDAPLDMTAQLLPCPLPPGTEDHDAHA